MGKPTAVFVLESQDMQTSETQMWGVYSTEKKCKDKAVEIYRRVVRFPLFWCNECEIDTGAICATAFRVDAEGVIEEPEP